MGRGGEGCWPLLLCGALLPRRSLCSLLSPTQARFHLVTQELWLYSNRLESVPPSIGRLTALKRLWLDRNDTLTSVPRELALLTNLQELYLDQSRVQHIPPEVLLLPALRRLYAAPAAAAQLQQQQQGPAAVVAAGLLRQSQPFG